MFVNQAFAQSGGGGGGMFGGIEPLIPLILIFVVFYFLLIRPQQKKAKQHKELLASLRRGDRVVTSGGLIGTITKVINDRELQLEIAEGVRVRVARGLISEVMARTEPADEAGDEEESGTNDKKDSDKKPKVASGR